MGKFIGQPGAGGLRNLPRYAPRVGSIPDERTNYAQRQSYAIRVDLNSITLVDASVVWIRDNREIRNTDLFQPFPAKLNQLGWTEFSKHRRISGSFWPMAEERVSQNTTNAKWP